MKLAIDVATQDDYPELAQLDHHISPQMLARKIAAGEVIVARLDERLAGWLRYGYFWDSIPFMNMLHVREDLRGQGIGTQLVTFWEQAMHEQGADSVLTSTLANERGQELYRKLGYRDCGALLLPDEPLEILFLKQLALP